MHCLFHHPKVLPLVERCYCQYILPHPCCLARPKCLAQPVVSLRNFISTSPCAWYTSFTPPTRHSLLVHRPSYLPRPSPSRIVSLRPDAPSNAQATLSKAQTRSPNGDADTAFLLGTYHTTLCIRMKSNGAMRHHTSPSAPHTPPASTHTHTSCYPPIGQLSRTTSA